MSTPARTSSNNNDTAADGEEDREAGDRRRSGDSASISSFKVTTAGSRSVAGGEPESIDPTNQVPKEPGQLYVQKGRPKLQLARSYTKPDAYGYLNKYGGVSFQRRFFILRGTILLYYVSHGHTEPKGVFLLDEARIHKGARLCERNNLINKMLANLNLATPYSVVITRPSGAAVELCAANEYQLDEWVNAFVATGAVERFSDIPIQAPVNGHPPGAGFQATGVPPPGGHPVQMPHARVLPPQARGMAPPMQTQMGRGNPPPQSPQIGMARPPRPEVGAAHLAARQGSPDPRGFPQGAGTGAPAYAAQTSRSNHTQSSSGHSVASFKGFAADENSGDDTNHTQSLEHIPSQEDSYYEVVLEEVEDDEGGMPSSNSQVVASVSLA
eukprot:gb/GECG01001674.1/.p1 GENE.gb/GECG01001674.1/~~gb/GECG01001674.1/.p1  ORF type:complete len:384 (+),score=45.67 gb/GECG01001674.1/:1-1152(+)